MKTFIKRFSETRIEDIAEVGGKNATLSEVSHNLSSKGIHVPDGFAVNVAAFKYFLEFNTLEPRLQELFISKNGNEPDRGQTGLTARNMIMGAKFPPEVESSVIAAYNEYFGEEDREVAIRSSAVSNTLAGEDFAGLFDSFLNIKGSLALIYAIKCCYASLYTDRAIQYREENGIAHDAINMAVGVQRMVRSDLACSGTGYTAASGNRIHIVGTWGLGDLIHTGIGTRDEFYIEKESLHREMPQIKKILGSKSRMLIYNDNAAGTNSTLDKTTPRELRTEFVLTDSEVEQLARWALLLEQHYAFPADFEWAKDGISKELYIIQARHARRLEKV